MDNIKEKKSFNLCKRCFEIRPIAKTNDSGLT